MIARRLLSLALVSLAAVLAACSAGNSGDQPVASVAVPTGIERFLLFPNPVVSGASFQTNSNPYASEYYKAVDPNNERTTLAAFKAVNGFGSTAGGAQERLVVFRDVRDLGYGRRMTGRYVPSVGGVPERIVFIVENYLVNVPGGGYNRINVDAAVAQDSKWHVGTNAIEWSCHPTDALADPTGCRRYAKYFNFGPDGNRQTFVDLDGRGGKAMPGPCITCHGGRGDPLEADGSFPKVWNTLLNRTGDVQARLHMFQVDTFEWSTTPGFTRSDQEAKLKDFNTWVLCSYPLPGGGAGPGCTRQQAATNEWQGTAAALVENAYGGPGLPNASFDDSVVPAGWASQSALYQQVVRPYCRTCHIVRGTNNEDDIDFSSELKFRSYADRIKAHVFDRGNMPLALIVYTDFWKSGAPDQLAAYIDSVVGAGTATDGSGKALKPGRPIANAGPALRMARAGANAPLSGADSLFASSYTWEILSAPGGGDGVITNANSQNATFLANVTGDYTVRLTARNGSQSSTATTTITVSSGFSDPANIRLAQVLDVLRNNPQNAATSCSASNCHDSPAPPGPPAMGTITGAPIVYAPIDRNGSGGAEDATDLNWLLSELRGRVNLTEVAASPLLRKPTGNHHAGNNPINLSAGPNFNAALASFSKVYYWMLNGAPAGGVAANAGANTTNTVTFAPTADIALSGASSIGATTYTWSILSEPGSPAASLLTPNSSSATLRVGNVGTYVVQLQASDGTYTDTATRTITVQETPVVAAFTPSGTVAVTFSGNPLAGSIALDSSSSTGNPTSCSWSINPSTPAATLTGTSCSGATLSLTAAAVGNSYDVTFTGSNVSTSNSITQTITVQSAGSGVTANAGANSTNSVTFANPSTVSDYPDPSGIPEATIALNGAASTGPGTLAYSWTVTGVPGNATGAYAPSIDSASSSATTLRVRRKGTYTVSLSVTNGLPPGPGNTATRTITVNVASGNTFTNVKNAFVNRGCTGCHVTGSTSPPSWDTDVVGGLTLYQRVTARVSADPAQSLILTCPSDGTCGMGQQAGFHGGDLSSYSLFLNWIMDGTPNN
jgi:mono/diheme cytochrome c family protein